jgi:putative nucleotidyltransferase with HDIG domain
MLFQDLQRANVELTLSYDATIEGWARALELRDGETEGHSRRVKDITIMLACRLGLPESELDQVRRGALLHDIGKMAIPDAILLQPGPLDASEWKIMRAHPVYAMQLMSPITFLKPALDITYCHHEKWDGTGYPRGLRGEEIPLSARIFGCRRLGCTILGAPIPGRLGACASPRVHARAKR